MSFDEFVAQACRQTRMFKSGGDSGVMILISTKDRRSRVYLGSLWSRDLRERISQICRETFVRGLVAQKPSSGVLAFVKAVDRIIRQSTSTSR